MQLKTNRKTETPDNPNKGDLQRCMLTACKVATSKQKKTNANWDLQTDAILRLRTKHMQLQTTHNLALRQEHLQNVALHGSQIAIKRR